MHSALWKAPGLRTLSSAQGPAWSPWSHNQGWFLWGWQRPRLTNKVSYQANSLSTLTTWSKEVLSHLEGLGGKTFSLCRVASQDRLKWQLSVGVSPLHCCFLCFTNAGYKQSFVFHCCQFGASVSIKCTKEEKQQRDTTEMTLFFESESTLASSFTQSYISN